MSDPIKERGEVAFKAAGDGVILRFRNSALKRIEAKYGEAFFNEFLDKCLAGRVSTEALEYYVAQGAEKDGQTFEVTEEIFDKIPVHDLAETVLDALCMAIKGLDAKTYVAQAMKAFEEHPDPLPQSPETS